MNFTVNKPIIPHTLWLLFYTTASLLVSFFYLDLTLANYFARPELEKVYYYSREITNIGYSVHYFIIALMGIIFSKWLYKWLYPKSQYLQKKINCEQNNNIYQWSFFTIKTLLSIGIIINILKAIIGRQRPHASFEFYNLNFDMLSINPHWHSFPSGHSQVVFTVATILLLIYPKQKYVFLSCATFFALTRITIHQHYLSDIIAGGFIGHIGTMWIYHISPPKICIK